MSQSVNRAGWVVLAMCIGVSGCMHTPATSSQSAWVPPDNNHYDPTKAATINVQLGLGYLKQGNISRAKSKLILALDQNSSDPVVQGAMGYFYEHTGNDQLAKQYYLKAIALAPGQGAPENNYGTFLCRQGQYRAAIPHFLSAANDRDYLQVAEAYENAGLCALSIPNTAQAAQFFYKATLNDPKRAQSLLELAELEFKQGQYAKAKQYLLRFDDVSLNTARSTWLGWQIASKMGDKNAAASYALLLQSKFGKSTEYQNYLHTKNKQG